MVLDEAYQNRLTQAEMSEAFRKTDEVVDVSNSLCFSQVYIVPITPAAHFHQDRSQSLPLIAHLILYSRGNFWVGNPLNQAIRLQIFQLGMVNNAGFGNYGNFIETPLEEELSMIQLNISSLVVLTKLFAKDMFSRKSGRIMNIGSVVSFLPMPYFSVYSATKAFVKEFSDTLAAELEGTGVIVSSLYPGNGSKTL